MHPSDPPLPETEFSPLRWSRILDAVPSTHSGLLYCIGTRYESGVNIYDDIRAFGRRGKIFHTHFRNVRGTIPTHGGYQEVALGDGDMNMFRVVQTLRSVGFDGGLQIDHLPALRRRQRLPGHGLGLLRGLRPGPPGGARSRPWLAPFSTPCRLRLARLLPLPLYVRASSCKEWELWSKRQPR